MGAPQSDLARRFASEFGLQVLKFRNFDAVVFQDTPIVKLFIPVSVRAMGGTAQNRRVEGDIEFVRRDDLVRLRPPSEKYENPGGSFGCPIFNFPWLIRHQRYVEDPGFFQALSELFNALPDDERGWRDTLGADFFELSGLDRLKGLVAYLRKLRPGED